MEFKVEKKCTLELNEFEMFEIMYAFNEMIRSYERSDEENKYDDLNNKDFLQSLYPIQSKLIRANELMKLKLK